MTMMMMMMMIPVRYAKRSAVTGSGLAHVHFNAEV
jgi:hypothetical protein